jgi:23S rRNA (cytosine1962-C5)-methyltransferase
MKMGRVTLKPGREASLLRRHPWVFSGAVAAVADVDGAGATVEIHAADGRWLARGSWSPQSQIRIRALSFDPQEEITTALFRNRLQKAMDRRFALFGGQPPQSFRLVNAESDSLPGVIVDRYAPYWVCQFLSAGAERWRDAVAAQLESLLPCRGIYERSEGEGRRKEGLPPRTGVLSGEAPPALLEVREHGLRFLVDVHGGHKTGFYIDQRENRRRLADFAAGRDLLNVFSYTGGFGINALAAGAAAVTHLDSSSESLTLARRNTVLNQLDEQRCEYICADAFEQLRRLRNCGRTFDLIVLDPPKFATSAHQLPAAARGYKDINLSAFKLLRPGGILFTFSCSGHMEASLFQKIVADAALDADRQAQILERLHQAGDHPVALSFPEAAYLKGLVCRVE